VDGRLQGTSRLDPWDCQHPAPSAEGSNDGKLIVPIVPDEARTFGLNRHFAKWPSTPPKGQKYTPHDNDMLLYYREEQDGQILEEGITEAGSMASFTLQALPIQLPHPHDPVYMYIVFVFSASGT